MAGEVAIVLAVPSAWASLEATRTRWSWVARQWSRSPRVRSLTIVDFPLLSRRRALARLATRRPSWMDGVDVIAPILPYAPTAFPTDSLARWRTARAIVRLLGPERPRLMVCANPLMARVASQVTADAVAFDAFDDWRHLTSMSDLRDRVQEGYAASPRMSVVSTNTATLHDRLAGEFHVDAHVVPNGVDLDQSNLADVSSLGLPTRPFAIYVGTVEQRVDLDLLFAVASLVPALPVVVVGPCASTLEAKLRGGPVRWVGPVDTRMIPALLARAAVGLVPHHVNALTMSMDPMKTLEYLAAGLPVVSTSLPGAAELSPRVQVADSADAFAAAVRTAAALPRLEGPDPAVAGRTWAAVAEGLLTLYTSALP